jgi:hypothetical protein
LRKVLRLLERLRPEREDGDVLWPGPFFVPRRRQWWPTRLRFADDAAPAGGMRFRLRCSGRTLDVRADVELPPAWRSET